ncbi:hypothetical protein XBKB1_700037 [Xenorhabdus bovienii str. kraussei Becker Underwood]|uniref:Uncharacterized protein n=1 Tax=Xenorhabdus bovienii str. kraussei Becker Underwood TaxID=1398204 RepID=A0A077Q0D0_XENBV|nr:hypothetical protein XBKB1_700037 [Xenorhabdus bovienii str. kraussei Becker Underwood]
MHRIFGIFVQKIDLSGFKSSHKYQKTSIQIDVGFCYPQYSSY